MYLVKTYKKSYKKLLTKEKRGDNICKHSLRKTLEKPENVDAKKLEKSLKKVLTRMRVCDILLKLSRKRGSDWTLKIKQRDKKRNPRFDGKDHQEEF